MGLVAMGNVVRELCGDCDQRALEGNADAASQLQARLIQPNRAVTSQFGVAGLKQAMEWFGLYGGPPRSPLAPLDESQKSALRGILADAELLSR